MAPGEVIDVRQHDGTLLRLRSLHPDYDPSDRYAAMAYMQRHQAMGEVVTGLLYVDPLATDLHTALNTIDAAAQHAGAGRAVPRRRGAGTAQRLLALSGGRRHHSGFAWRAHHGRTHRFPVHLAQACASAWARMPACARPRA